ncbi:MAG: dUTP diphosphatase [Candidatus Poseidoniaceae archaeon]|nr:dUTP diphosphatase [Candidatus Poseidoniaceae archaeon]
MARDDMTRDTINVSFTKLNEQAIAPARGSELAAGWDLYALEDTVVPKGSTCKIHTGLAIAIPAGWEGQVRCRSSLGKKGMMLPNGVGTIDADYRGELMVLATWIGPGDSFQIEKGERIAQMIFAPVPEVVWHEVEDVVSLGNTERGEGGFGSTGK